VHVQQLRLLLRGFEGKDCRGRSFRRLQARIRGEPGGPGGGALFPRKPLRLRGFKPGGVRKRP